MVAAGLTFVEPLADVEVNVPGVTATLVAPETDQLKALLEPETMLAGFAAKEPMCGAEFCCPGMVWEVAEPAQAARAAQQTFAQTSAKAASHEDAPAGEPSLLPRDGVGERIAPPYVLVAPV